MRRKEACLMKDSLILRFQWFIPFKSWFHRKGLPNEGNLKGSPTKKEEFFRVKDSISDIQDDILLRANYITLPPLCPCALDFQFQTGKKQVKKLPNPDSIYIEIWLSTGKAFRKAFQRDLNIETLCLTIFFPFHPGPLFSSDGGSSGDYTLGCWWDWLPRPDSV